PVSAVDKARGPGPYTATYSPDGTRARAVTAPAVRGGRIAATVASATSAAGISGHTADSSTSTTATATGRRRRHHSSALPATDTSRAGAVPEYTLAGSEERRPISPRSAVPDGKR